MLPADHVVRLEDQVEEPGMVEALAQAQETRARRQDRGGALVQHDHGDGGIRGGLSDHGGRQRGRVGLEEVEVACHQKTRYRLARAASAATPSASMGATGWPSAFQSGSGGAAPVSTWKTMPSFFSAERNLAMSSPSTRSSVSVSSRWAAGPLSTTATSFSPATTPSAMRMASLARWDTRGSSEISTSTGRPSGTRSVQRDEAIGADDDVGEHDQAAVGGALREREPALLAAEGAHEEARA